MAFDPENEFERLRKMAAIAQIGWWEADFSAGHYICSDYLAELLQLEGNTISFGQFRKLVREDYRDQVVREFNATIHQNFYEQTFPIKTRYGYLWVHTRLIDRENIPGRGEVSFGIMQKVDSRESQAESVVLRVNELLYRQNSISQSLLRFLKDEDMEKCVNTILHDILDVFRGGRVYIFEYDREYLYQNCIFEVVDEGVDPEIDTLQHISADSLPWWKECTTAGKPVILDSLEQLPPHARAEYDILSRQHIKSLMVAPMMVGERVWGYMGIDLVKEFRTWTNEDFQWLSSLANIVSICLELRKAKDEAEKERSFLSNLFSYMPMGYVRMRVMRDEHGKTCDYRIVEANQLSSDLIGLPLSDYEGRMSSELENGLFPSMEFISELLDSENTHKEHEIYFKKTLRRVHGISYSPEQDEVVSLLLDATETYSAHEALDRSEKLFKGIFENMPAGIELYDKDACLIDLNPKDMEIFGIGDKADVLGVDFFSNPNVSEEQRERIRHEDQFDFRIKYSFDLAKDEGYYLPDKKKSIELYTKASKLYDSNGNFNGYLLINIDNTEQIDAINRISEFENFFLLISEYAKVGYTKVNLCDSDDGYAIKQWYTNLGETENTPLSSIIGVYSHLHPDDQKKVVDFQKDAVLGQGVTFRSEVRVLRPGTTDQWNWLRTHMVVTKYEPQNNKVEIIGINYDITELKETESKLIEAKNKAEAMDKLKSAFIANMSHEIRTPLNAIVGFSTLLLDAEDVEERRQYMQIVQDNNEVLLQLVTDILNLSKIEAGVMEYACEDVDVNMMCQNIVSSLLSKTGQGVELRVRQGLPEIHMAGDFNRLHQVVYNLANNAVKFTQQGTIEIGYKKEQDVVEFYVSDTGIGIPEQQQATIFDRFVKVNSFVQGTGLGLSICKSIVEQFGGKIGVESKAGKGSRFWFTIPYRPVGDLSGLLPVDSGSDR